MITRIEKEGVKAFNAFRIYVEMGNERTQEAVARKLRLTSRTLIGRWSQRYHWQDRLRQHMVDEAKLQEDAVKAAALLAATENQRRIDTVKERAWEFANELFEKAKTMLRYPLVRQEKSEEKKDGKGRKTVTTVINPVGWRMADAARMAETADALARLATGMATGNFNHQLSGADGGPIPVTIMPPRVRLQLLTSAESEKVMREMEHASTS